ncbi:MAG: hypothetical protein WB239_15480 [Acidimicrobiia bacterium]
MIPAPPQQIVCVDCGGRAHLITHLPPEESLEPGIILSYRCQECRDRWDVVWEMDEGEPDHG